MKHHFETQQLAEAFRLSMRHDLDENRTYHPVFCTTSVSDMQWAEFVLADPVNPSNRRYLEIPSTSTKSFEALKQAQCENTENAGNSEPEDTFINWTTDEVYSFWRQHLRAATDLPLPQPLSAFTFIILDSTCLTTSPLSCIILTDAPDFSQPPSPPILQSIRVEVSRAWDLIIAIEELTMTPSECEHWARNPADEDFSVLNVVARPPTTVTVVVDEGGRDLVRRWATVGEARENKMRAVRAGETEGWVVLKGFPEGVEGAVYDL